MMEDKDVRVTFPVPIAGDIMMIGMTLKQAKELRDELEMAIVSGEEVKRQNEEEK